MPFDLDRTSHVFTPAESGGVQEVVADDPADTEQVRLIREHVRQEARRFARGDFDDPAALHGDDMPGLPTLRAEYRKMTAHYSELPDGAKITYVSMARGVIKALHDWFEAQLSDHGEHAERGEAEH
ncbi:MAG: aspartate carbamoyltransferase [Actinophytocola sp.]|nr:aspartate carbamoyltransferase [Actinophytocola sp.]